MPQDIFDEISNAFERGGTAQAIQSLINILKQSGDFHRLFEARTMQARHALGLPLLSSVPSSELPSDIRTQLEDQMIAACREVGEALLESGDIAAGYQYLQMIGELDPVRTALETISPEEQDVPSFVEIALSRGVHPVRGIDLILKHYGLCQAISACESLLAQGTPIPTRDQAIRRLVRAVHEELVHRLQSEIEQREGSAPTSSDVETLLKGRDWLFEEDNYHIDTSHLNAIVRMARLLGPGPEIEHAVALCTYGNQLSSKYRYPDPAPFEDVYSDSRRFFLILSGEDAEDGLRFFKEQAERLDPSEVGTYPSEVYLHLLRETGRWQDAIDYIEKRLSDLPSNLTSAINSLCEVSRNFDAMNRFARERHDPISFLASLASRESIAE